LLDACGFDAVDERQHLALELKQLRASFAESPVGVGELPHVGKLLGRWADVLRPTLAAVREDSAGVEFSLGAAAVGFSTAAAEGVEGAGEEGLATEEGFEECLELKQAGVELGAKRAEVVGHGLSSEGERPVCSLLLLNTYRYQRFREKNLAGAKKWNLGQLRWEPAPARRGGKEKGREGFRSGRTSLFSPRAIGTRVAASYAVASRKPLTSESQCHGAVIQT
jgi:hypothetical protein